MRPPQHDTNVKTRTLVQKLGIKPGFCIFVDGAPASYESIVGKLPDGARLAARPKVPLDAVHLFVREAAPLRKKLIAYREMIAPDGMIWVSWPKKSSRLAIGLTDVVVRGAALAAGLVDIKVCAIDDVWSGLKLVIRKDQRAGSVRRGPAPKS
jgi:Protein of unknown function (DUF3052)